MRSIPARQRTDSLSLLTVNNLSISFHSRAGRIIAVDGASFELEPGKTLGIVGESGSGKSVLCYSLLGLLRSPPAIIEKGTALFDGMDLLTLPEYRLRMIRGNRIGMVFQDPMTSLNPYLSIGKQVIEPLCLHRQISRKTAWGIAIQALEEVGLDGPARLMNNYPHQLSGGMRQRVMIAMAMINKPEILIADEPTTALDVTIQAQILELIKELQREKNIAVIFVSHDLGVIARIADHVLIMQHGRIVERGSANDIFQHPRHAYTRNLLASIPTGTKPHKYDPAGRNQHNVLLSVQHLKTWYDGDNSFFGGNTNLTVKAVDNVSFEVYRGETLGLVGESGSGKSTLGRSIMQLLDIKEGTITLNNQELAGLGPRQLKQARYNLQMIFQDPYASLNPRITIFDTLAEALQIRNSMSDRDLLAAVSSLLNDVGLEPAHVYKYPHEFSGGQRQRIAIARALAVKPQLIIADEPVSALDVTIQSQILELLLDLVRRHGLTMIFISHDLSVVRYMADRTAVMYRGRIVELDHTETVFNHPKHPYTQTLLSAIPVVKLTRKIENKATEITEK